MSVTIPFLASAPTVWAFYFNSVKKFIEDKMSNINPQLNISSKLLSVRLKPNGEFMGNEYKGFSEDMDWIIIGTEGTEENPKRNVHINFLAADDEQPGISFCFAIGEEIDDSYHVADFRFKPEILADERIYEAFEKWISTGEDAVDSDSLFSCHTKRYC